MTSNAGGSGRILGSLGSADGTGRVEACEPPRRLLVRTKPLSGQRVLGHDV